MRGLSAFAATLDYHVYALAIPLSIMRAVLSGHGPSVRPFYNVDATLWYEPRDSTLPTSALYALVPVPLCCLGLVEYCQPIDSRGVQGKVLRSVRLILGFACALAIEAFIVEMGKVGVGYPRPHAVQACLGSVPHAGQETRQVASVAECLPGTSADVFKSFPSGHASASACMAWYLVSRMIHASADLRNGKGHRQILVLLALLPVVLSWGVCCSRILDYKHDKADVVAGHFIGGVVGVLTYLTIAIGLEDVPSLP